MDEAEKMAHDAKQKLGDLLFSALAQVNYQWTNKDQHAVNSIVDAIIDAAVAKTANK